MTTTVTEIIPPWTRNVFHNGRKVGRVTRYFNGGLVYVPHLSEDPPSCPNRVVCATWTEARETILGIYR